VLRYHEALKCFEQAREKDATNVQLLHYLGLTYYKLGQYSRGNECYIEAQCYLDANNHTPYVSLLYSEQALCLGEIGNAEKSLEKLNEALTLSNKAITNCTRHYSASHPYIAIMEHKKADILSKIATLEFNSQMVKPNNNPSIVSDLKSYYLSKDTLPRFLEDDDSVAPMKINNSYVNLAIITHSETKEKEEQLGKAKKESQLREGFLADYESLHHPKEAIELKDVFLRDKQATNAHKKLIYGRAGIGKSTLVHHAAYQWAGSKLWPEFNYVFWLPLRNLTSDWDEKKYNKDNLCKNALACFIHCCYSDNAIKLNDITSILTQENPSKILLLLDGYDEIAQLHNEKHSLISDVLNKAIKGSFYV
ncbi:MAG: NACHT domain-containing protein, partial [Burkholderiales bacterium]